MTDSWDRTLFDRELKSILESKLPVSASKITSLQSLATVHPKHHNYIVQCITRFIETAPPDYRLAGLYVIDAISRVVHKQLRKRDETNEEGSFEAEGYLKRFGIVLREDSLQGCFEPCSVKDKDKVKKTLDFWEQGNIYPKEVVQYVKGSFLNQSKQDKVPPPPVDTASLLATLSNIGNLNIPGLTTTAAPPQQENNDTSLPPALAKLLGGIVTSSPTLSPVSTSSTPPLQTRPDPRVTKDPRQKQAAQWPPQIPSSRMERKSRWGHDDDNNNKTHVHSPPPPPPTITSTTTTTTTTTTPIPTPTTTQDPWFNRQAMTQAIMNNDNTNYSYQANPSYYQQPYQQPYGQDGPFNQASFGGPPTSQFSQRPVVPRAKPAFSPFDRAGPSFHRGGGSGGGGGGGFMRHGASAFERNGPSPQYERNGSRFDRNGHTQYEQNTSQYERNESQYERNGSFGTQPLPDPSLAPGFIRVLTRTLFVGPIPDHYEKEDVSKLFSKYGDIASVIVSKKLKGRHNAFLKYTTRASTEAAKHNGAGLIVEGVPVKVNWGFGFGPKKYFDYTRGDSIIPLSELSEEEKDNLVIARIGGFQGQPVRDGMIIEEPEAQYKPEWNGDRGLKRSSNNYPIDENRKRTRM